MLRLFRIHIHKDDIRPDLADAFPGDDVFEIIPKDTETDRPRHDQCQDTARLTVNVQVFHKAQSAAVLRIDNFFFFQLTQTNVRLRTLCSSYL